MNNKNVFVVSFIYNLREKSVFSKTDPIRLHSRVLAFGASPLKQSKYFKIKKSKNRNRNTNKYREYIYKV